MKTLVKTIVEGTLGLLALYVVGRVAYQAGKEMAQTECHYQAMRNEIDEKKSAAGTGGGNENEAVEVEETLVVEPKQSPAKKPGKLAMALGLGKLLHRKDSMIGNLIKHPEEHKIEAFVDGNDLHIDVRRRLTPA